MYDFCAPFPRKVIHILEPTPCGTRNENEYLEDLTCTYTESNLFQNLAFLFGTKGNDEREF